MPVILLRPRDFNILNVADVDMAGLGVHSTARAAADPYPYHERKPISLVVVGQGRPPHAALVKLESLLTDFHNVL